MEHLSPRAIGKKARIQLNEMKDRFMNEYVYMNEDGTVSCQVGDTASYPMYDLFNGLYGEVRVTRIGSGHSVNEVRLKSRVKPDYSSNYETDEALHERVYPELYPEDYYFDSPFHHIYASCDHLITPDDDHTEFLEDEPTHFGIVLEYIPSSEAADFRGYNRMYAVYDLGESYCKGFDYISDIHARIQSDIDQNYGEVWVGYSDLDGKLKYNIDRFKRLSAKRRKMNNC